MGNRGETYKVWFTEPTSFLCVRNDIHGEETFRAFVDLARGRGRWGKYFFYIADVIRHRDKVTWYVCVGEGSRYLAQNEQLNLADNGRPLLGNGVSSIQVLRPLHRIWHNIRQWLEE